MKWKDITDNFTEEQRNYKNTYLEIDEVLDNVIEVSLFSSKEDLYKIYISFGIMYGIVYVEKDKAEALRKEIKKVIVKEYEKNGEPSDEFIDEFGEKYKICIPNDIFFNTEDIFGF